MCRQFRQTKHIQSNRYNKSNNDHQYVTSHKYSSHYMIIKFIGFESI